MCGERVALRLLPRSSDRTLMQALVRSPFSPLQARLSPHFRDSHDIVVCLLILTVYWLSRYGYIYCSALWPALVVSALLCNGTPIAAVRIQVAQLKRSIFRSLFLFLAVGCVWREGVLNSILPRKIKVTTRSGSHFYLVIHSARKTPMRQSPMSLHLRPHLRQTHL